MLYLNKDVLFKYSFVVFILSQEDGIDLEIILKYTLL